VWGVAGWLLLGAVFLGAGLAMDPAVRAVFACEPENSFA